jgi:predicted esterase
MNHFANWRESATDQASARHLNNAHRHKISATDDSLISRRVKHLVGVISVATMLLGACSNSNNSGESTSIDSQNHAVGTTSMTLIDTSRSTGAHGSVPEASSRTLETTIVYPAEGTPGSAVTSEAPANMWGAPFPLIVLSHGLGGSVGGLLPMAEVWASRGYVVALPRFPLTNIATPGGPVAQDVQNQPADVSFVIDQMLAESDTAEQLLSNAVNGDKIAASGHSNGGITTYGLVANSCCRDRRIDTAVVLSSVVSPSFPEGEYDFTDAPPIFVVHGVNDVLLIYNQAVRSYNEFLPPKGLLTLEASDHGSYLRPGEPAFDVTAQATADFLDGELRGDSAALEGLPEYQVPGIATMHWAPDEASNVPVETLPEPETNRQAFLSADNNLTDGQIITVTWSGYLPEQVVNVLQCTGDGFGGAGSCNLGGGAILHPDPEGMGSLALVIRIGPIGDGVCDSTNPCSVIVNDAGLTDDDASVRIPITLAN